MIEKIINIAKAEVGTKESPPNSNRQKYGEAYGWNGVPWCAEFVWWCFQMGGFVWKFKTASCDEIYRQALYQNKWFTKDFKVGDIVIFDFSGNKARNQHVGIIAEVKQNSIITIEGNTSINGSQDNGGMVAMKERSLSVVKGVYRPIEEEVNPTPKKKTDTAKVSFIKEVQSILGVKITGKYSLKLFNKTITLSVSKNPYNKLVKPLQTYLKHLDYYTGRLDGIFGNQTKSAVIKFQKANSCVQDGEITAKQKTWKKLLK